MRFVNWCLNLTIHVFLLVLLIAASRAQVNDNMPHVVQSGRSPFSMGIVLPDQMTSGNWLIGAVQSEGGCTNSVTLTDTNGIVPFITMGTTVCNPSGTGNPFDPALNTQLFWGQATSSGFPNIQLATGSFPRQFILYQMEVKGNFTSVVDAQATGTNSNTQAITTTAQNDFIVAALSQIPNTTLVTSDPSQQFGTNAYISDFHGNMLWYMAGAAGVTTPTFVGSVSGQTLAVAAFKPAALTFGTTALPIGGKSLAYYAQLAAYGGTGTLSYTRTAGTWPTGCSDASLSSAGVISCTPTQTGTFSLTFQVSDGTHTASAVLAMTVNSTFPSMFVRSSYHFAVNTLSGTLNSATNDLNLLLYFGDDTHGTDGYLLRPAAIANGCSDQFTRGFLQGGGNGGGINVWGAQGSCSGVYSLQEVSSGAPGTPLAGVALAISGAEIPVDPVAINQSSPGAVTSTTLHTCTTVNVPGTLLLSLSSINCGATGGGSCTMTTSTNSPFELVDQQTSGFGGVPFAVYSQVASTAGSYCADTNFGISGGDLSGTLPVAALVQLRPLATGLPAFTGEKVRRIIY